MSGPAPHPTLGTLCDVIRNYHAVLAAARDALGRPAPTPAWRRSLCGRAWASEPSTVAWPEGRPDRRAPRLALEEILSSTHRALARIDGSGLEEFLRALGQSFADDARYANLLIQRRTEDATVYRIRAAIDELTARAIAAGAVSPGITPGDVLALVWGMRGLVQAAGEGASGEPAPGAGSDSSTSTWPACAFPKLDA